MRTLVYENNPIWSPVLYMPPPSTIKNNPWQREQNVPRVPPGVDQSFLRFSLKILPLKTLGTPVKQLSVEIHCWILSVINCVSSLDCHKKCHTLLRKQQLDCYSSNPEVKSSWQGYEGEPTVSCFTPHFWSFADNFWISWLTNLSPTPLPS